MEENSVVQEAIRRLPKQQQYDREWRFKRAQDLAMHHSYLPKEQWVTSQQVSFLFLHCGEL